MANNAVFRFVDLTSEWAPLADEPLVADVTLSLLATGGFVQAGMDFEIRQGEQSASWPINASVRLEGIDLSTIEARSTYTDLRLSMIGNTR